MTQENEQRDDELFERHLDGLSIESDRESLLAALRNKPDRQRQERLQEEIDGGLGRLFDFKTPSCESIVASLEGKHNVEPPLLPPTGSRRFNRYRLFALAASLLFIATLLFLWPAGRRDDAYSAARPLAELYRSAVESGFEPSYECHEPERFAETFERRQGKALKLLPMPDGSRMLGLAFTGGLSRNTTAMLAYVDDQPVMVFVDQATNDDKTMASADGALHIFRDERDGLVYYEVTPFDEPRVTPLLAPLTTEHP